MLLGYPVAGGVGGRGSLSECIEPEKVAHNFFGIQLEVRNSGTQRRASHVAYRTASIGSRIVPLAGGVLH